MPTKARLLAPAPFLVLALGLALTLSGCQGEGELGDRLQQALAGGGWGWAYAIAFLAGVATSLTPCVYPLIPITVSLFGARDDEVTRLRALLLAAAYVGGIAAMYTGLGLFCALSGVFFGSFLSSPYVIVPIALFFGAMAASMFGAFELALPAELQGRLSQVGGKGGGGAFLMGLVAGVIAAPCTGPPLLALLGFVATQRSVLLGGSLLFVYALGIGVLFFAIAGFSLKLPRSGAWMEGVKSVFGVAMIVAALYFLRNVAAPLRKYGQATTIFLSAHLGLAVLGAALGAIHLTFHDGLARTARKGLGVALMCLGLFGVVGWTLTPRPLNWMTDEAAAVARARAERRPLFIDFGADWCLPCKELELRTFSDDRVARELSRFVLLKVDCSQPDDRVEALQARYNAGTLPTVLVYDGAGKELLRLREFTPPEKLLPFLEKAR
jgi:thiol:disulfide interchange protein DsbD